MALLLFCLIIVTESCSSSILVDKWSDPTFNGSPLDNILIIAVMNNPVQRRIWEDAFSAELSKHGVNSTSSYHLFPDALPDTNQVVEVIRKNNFEGLLVTRSIEPETKTNYVEPTVTTEQIARYSNLKKRFVTYYKNVEHPGYVQSQTINRRTIDIWVIRDEGRMIWSATSNTPELNTAEAVQKDIADLVIPELVSSAIIKTSK
jgi:hypothetical protein